MEEPVYRCYFRLIDCFWIPAKSHILKESFRAQTQLTITILAALIGRWQPSNARMLLKSIITCMLFFQTGKKRIILIPECLKMENEWLSSCFVQFCESCAFTPPSLFHVGEQRTEQKIKNSKNARKRGAKAVANNKPERKTRREEL